MKKFFALLLALVMVLSLVACGDKKTDDNQDNNTDDQQGGTTTYTNPDDIDDNMTSEDGKYEIAFVTDVGQLKDKSFNQGTYDGVKLYAANNKLSYKYYQPANKDQATDDDRYEAMKAAVDQAVAALDAGQQPAIVTRRPCLLIKRMKHENGMCVVNADKCRSCKSCLKVGCPAISMENGKAFIDRTQCVGCTVCAQACPFGAIEKEEK